MRLMYFSDRKDLARAVSVLSEAGMAMRNALIGAHMEYQQKVETAMGEYHTISTMLARLLNPRSIPKEQRRETIAHFRAEIDKELERWTKEAEERHAAMVKAREEEAKKRATEAVKAKPEDQPGTTKLKPEVDPAHDPETTG